MNGILILFSLAGVGYLWAAALLVRRFARRERPRPAICPPITVLKPVCGLEPELAANLASFLDQDYPEAQFIFGVQDPHDPALAILRGLVALHPGKDIDIVIVPDRHGANGKISNVLNMGPRIRHDLIVLADSDMRADPDYLRVLAAELEPASVGAVTCLYRAKPVGGVSSQLGALFINEYFLPNALLSRALNSEEGCFGATIAIKRSVLQAIGGFGAFKDVLADDHEIGRCVRQLGLHVALSSKLVTDTAFEPDLRALILHELRWARTIRLVNPVGFLGSLITLPVPFALLDLLFLGISVRPLAALTLALAARIWFHRRVERDLSCGQTPIWLLPVRDCLTFMIVIASFLGRQVRWGQSTFRTAPDGTIALASTGGAVGQEGMSRD